MPGLRHRPKEVSAEGQQTAGIDPDDCDSHDFVAHGSVAQPDVDPIALRGANASVRVRTCNDGSPDGAAADHRASSRDVANLGATQQGPRRDRCMTEERVAIRRRLPVAISALLVAGVIGGCVQVVMPTATTDVAPTPTPLPTPTPTPRATPTRQVEVSGSIDPTGRTDVSREMQRFVDSVPDDSVINFPAGATYRLDGNGIVLDGRRDLVFSGKQVRLLGSGCGVTDSLFVIGRHGPSSGIRIHGFQLVGDNPGAGTADGYEAGCEFQMGVAVYGSQDIEVAGVTVDAVRGDCLYVGGGGDPWDWSSDVTFRDSVCNGPGRMGVAVVAGRRVSVERIDVKGVGISAFDIEPNVAREGAADIRFVDNTVGSFGVARDWNPSWLFEANGDPDAIVRDVVVQGNRLWDQPLFVKAQVPNRFDISVLGNSSTVPADGPVMYFRDTIGVVVRENDQPLTGGELASFRNTEGVDYDG
jgi:hypothetical protein